MVSRTGHRSDSSVQTSANPAEDRLLTIDDTTCFHPRSSEYRAFYSIPVIIHEASPVWSTRRRLRWHRSPWTNHVAEDTLINPGKIVLKKTPSEFPLTFLRFAWLVSVNQIVVNRSNWWIPSLSTLEQSFRSIREIPWECSWRHSIDEWINVSTLFSLRSYRMKISKRLPYSWPRRNGPEHSWKLPILIAGSRWLIFLNRDGNTLGEARLRYTVASGCRFFFYLCMVTSWHVFPRLSLIPAYWNNEVFILERKRKRFSSDNTDSIERRLSYECTSSPTDLHFNGCVLLSDAADGKRRKMIYLTQADIVWIASIVSRFSL